MTAPIDELDVVARVRALDPASRVRVDEDALHSLLDAILLSRNRRTRRRVTAFVASFAALTAVGVSAPALADGAHHFLAETGWFSSPNPPDTKLSSGAKDQASTESDSGEWISVTSPDFVAYSQSILPPEVVLPSSYSLEKFSIVVARTQQEGFPAAGTIQAVGIQGNYEQVARCLWTREWLTANTAHDSSRSNSAALVLHAAARWPATVSTDGGGIVAGLEAVAQSASDGDAAPVAREIALNCGPIPDGILN